jgi:putative ABC transport system permease protein
VVTLRALDRKLLRDLRGMWGQALAIVFVVIAGVTTYVSMRSVAHTLETTLDRYYRDYRFPDGFATVRRAPARVADRLRLVPGVAAVETRVSAAVSLEVPGYADAVSGRIVGVPEDAQPELNRLFLRAGRLVRAGREDEVLLNEAFADAHGLAPGDRLTGVINGRRRALTVVGVALSPEFLMQMPPGMLFPDPERYGVLWMGRAALAAAYDMEGAFNEVAFTLAPGAAIEDVLAAFDAILASYGGLGSHGRSLHPSHRLISDEFRQLAAMATVLPLIFLAVAAFLLNIVVTRLISLQREQIAVIKAFGYRNTDVGLHYIKFVLVIALFGAVLGTALGARAGSALGGVYLEFYRFPGLDYTLRWTVVLTAVLLTVGASLLGVVRAVAIAVRLPPAEAMRPEPPATYRRALVERLGLQRLLDQPTRMILRSLERRPFKAALTSLGIASSCAILIMGFFWGDVIDHIVHVQYGLAQRDDVTVSFVQPTSIAALHELRALPGVRHAEPFRSVPVRLRNGHHRRDAAIDGIPAAPYLRRILDRQQRTVPVPPEGLVLTERLARALDVRPGDSVFVEVLEGRRPTRAVPVAGLAEQYLGMAAYMDLDAANRLAGGGPVISGAFLLTDAAQEAALTRALRERPGVAGMVSQERAVEAYMETAARSMLVMAVILSVFAGVIAFGVIYNSVRIALSERDRELASMRVLGFTRGEVAFVLLGELAVLVMLAIPVGFLLGGLAAAGSIAALETEMYSFPVVLRPPTFGLAAAIVLVAALASGLLVRRRLDRLDLVGVLKTGA